MNKEMTQVSDLNLLKHVSKGNENAFRRLYDQTHKKTYFYLYRLLKNKETTEDVMVETYTEIWKGAGKFRGNSKVSTWIMSIARNLAMNHFKRAKIHDNIDNFPDLSNEVNPDMENLNRHRLLKKAMAGISVKHREIIDLVFFHEMTYREISELLKIPESTVKTRVFYAKDALKGSLDNIGVKKDDL